MNCENCGAELRKHDTLCAACGAKVKPTRTCPECHFPAREGARYCVKCGASVEPSGGRKDTADARAHAPDRAPEVRPARPLPASGPASVTRPMHWLWPTLLLILAAALGFWMYTRHSSDSASPADEARPAAEKSAPASATRSAPTSSGSAAVPRFSTQQAFKALYGNYDPNLDGAFWTVSGAPKAFAQWNGRSVFLRPLISRTFEQRNVTRHILLTNSLDVKDGLVVKQGAGCRTCPSLIGASVFEKGPQGWTLISRHDFLAADGAWGAPPKVSLMLSGTGGIELQLDRPAIDQRTPARRYSIVLRDRAEGSARADRTR